jgi:hypothetical protein
MARTSKPVRARNVRIPLHLADSLETYSEMTGVDVNSLISLAIYEYVSNHVDTGLVELVTEDEAPDGDQ